jgi:hypothetical protein
MGRLDYLSGQFEDRQFQQTVESDLDMLVIEQMYANTRGQRRPGGASRDRATSGWRNRGLFFWIMLIIMIYWFILRPLGL